MGEITIDEILERGIKLPEDRLSFPVEEFDNYWVDLDNVAGVYVFSHGVRGCLYVGISASIRERITSHIKGQETGNSQLYAEMTSLNNVSVAVYKENNLSKRELYENYIILKENPICNKAKLSVLREGYSIHGCSKRTQEEIVQMYLNGESYKSITEKTSMNKHKITRTLKYNNIYQNRSGRKMTEGQRKDRDEEILLKYSEGSSYSQICEDMGVSKSLVSTVVRDNVSLCNIESRREIELKEIKNRNEKILIEVLSKGKNTKDVASSFGVSVDVVQRAVKKHKEVLNNV